MASRRPIRFGLLVERALTLPALRDTARRAEEAGFATLLYRDHLVDEPFGPQLGPLTALALVAAVTTRLRIGTLVLANDFRHPAILAKEAATLDVLSGGRLELGLGAGFLAEEYRRAGLTLDPIGTRIDRLAESLAVLKGLWADGPLTFAGAHYRIDGLNGFPKPVQQPRPPVLIGAGGPRMLRLAAREADIVGLQSVATRGGAVAHDPGARTAAAVGERVALVREAAGPRFDALELSVVLSLGVTERPTEAARALVEARGWALPPGEVLDMPSVALGPLPALEETLLARREGLGVSYFVVPDQSLAAAAPLVARLTGR
jgi:probable F420-dependent oxidoreductase